MGKGENAGKKICVTTGVRRAGTHRFVTDGYNITLLVKIALNTNAKKYYFNSFHSRMQ